MSTPRRQPDPSTDAEDVGAIDEIESALSAADAEIEAALANAGQSAPVQTTDPAEIAELAAGMGPSKKPVRQFPSRAVELPSRPAAQPGTGFVGRLADAAQGFSQGGSFGWGDEVVSAVLSDKPMLGAYFAPDGAGDGGIPRTYAAGSAERSMRQGLRADAAQARDRSPLAYTAGNIAGGMAATAPLTAIAPAATAVGRMGQAAKIAAPIGVIAGAGESESETPHGVALDALKGGVLSAGTAGLVTGGAEMVRAAPGALRSAAAGMRDRSLTSRAGAVGAYGGALSKLAAKKGPGYVRQIGAAAEKLKDESGAVMPMSARRYADLAEAKRAALGGGQGEIGTALREAGESGVQINMAPTAQKLRERAMELADAEVPELTAQGEVLWRAADRLDELGSVSPAKAQAMKSARWESAGYKPGTVSTASDALSKKTHGMIAEDLSDAMVEQISPVAPRYGEAMREYGPISDIAKLANKRVVQEAGNQPVSLPSAGYGTVGALMGGGPGAAAAVGGWEIAKRVGNDALAGTQRHTSRALGALGSAMERPAHAAMSAEASAIPSRIAPSFMPAAAFADNDADFNEWLDRTTTVDQATAENLRSQQDPEFRALQRQRSSDRDDNEQE